MHNTAECKWCLNSGPLFLKNYCAKGYDMTKEDHRVFLVEKLRRSEKHNG